jgi:dephospho-CoA kinase
MLIGLTGPNGSGKGEAAQYLKDKGLPYFSLSDVVREEAAQRGLEPSRENLIKIGNDLRLNYGSGILAKRIRKKIKGDAVVDSIRNPMEIEELRKVKNFFLLGIDAPVTLRFQRSLERGRIGDGATLEEFQQREEMENSEDSSHQQLGKCMKMADFVILNEGTLEALQSKIEEVLSRLEKK